MFLAVVATAAACSASRRCCAEPKGVVLLHRGSLELDCRDFNNSGVEQCFVGGMAEPQPCKPASATQQYPALTQALASGQALDGNEGSLCVLNTGAAAPAGAKSPFIPASAGGGGCNLGLNCLTLGVSSAQHIKKTMVTGCILQLPHPESIASLSL